MGIDHLNWDQHSMKEGHVRSLGMDRERQEVMIRALQSGHQFIGVKSGGNHIKIYIKDDGLVTTASTGGERRGVDNFESQMRRNLRTVGKDFPRRNESLKAFQRRMARQQGNNNEQE